MPDEIDIPTYYRTLVHYDWVVSRSWNRLHFADLTNEQYETLADEGMLPGPVKLKCGRTAGSIAIPGLFTRMGAMRCTGCCRATGMPPGKGSPKNDDQCRPMIGLPPNGQEAA